ncbi:MAG: tRNA (guanine-N(1)-)-methyltransferase [Patescibacteria group bacterium]|nr:MAG: tRNA (guanine-N(1)-)-methyltransferase [Patescibacteria group bacterium]
MRFTVITLFPEIIANFTKFSVLGRALDSGLLELNLVQLREFAKDKHRTVDDAPYGGGAGMVIKPDIVFEALQSAKLGLDKEKTVLLSPAGYRFDQSKAKEFSGLEHLILISSNYEGVDARVEKYVDETVSIGDYVLSNGELAAAVVIDAVSRLVPGVLGNSSSSDYDSFFEVEVAELINIIGKNTVLKKLQAKGVTRVKLLDYPSFTRPQEFRGDKVPEVLLSGNHLEIKRWRVKQAFLRTVKIRPDLLGL